MASRLLAIDTSGANCSCALVAGGAIVSRSERLDRAHAEKLLPMVDEVLREAGVALNDVDAFAFGMGPGSFTGLRIAAGVVQGLARGCGAPVVPVSSLRALAQGACRRFQAREVIALFDARMGEVYAGAYRLADNGLMEAVSADRVCAPEALSDPFAGAALGAGAGWPAYREVLAPLVDRWPPDEACQLEPDALDVAAIALPAFENGEFVQPQQAVPVYLRNQVAKTKAQRAALEQVTAPNV